MKRDSKYQSDRNGQDIEKELIMYQEENKKQKFITLGEIMLRLTPPDCEKIRTADCFEARYGGSEANVALSLANLGIDSTYFKIGRAHV